MMGLKGQVGDAKVDGKGGKSRKSLPRCIGSDEVRFHFLITGLSALP